MIKILTCLSVAFLLRLSPFATIVLQTGTPPLIPPKVYFEKSYTNFAWGYQHHGIYVDPQGNIYSYAFNRGDKPWSPQQPAAPTGDELKDKYSHGKNLVNQIAPKELLEKLVLVESARKGRLLKRVQQGADQGSSVTRCYWFDPTQGRYKEIELNVKGDWSYENLSPSAKELTKWMDSLQKPN